MRHALNELSATKDNGASSMWHGERCEFLLLGSPMVARVQEVRDFPHAKSLNLMVPSAGIEPATRGFSVRFSTVSGDFRSDANKP